MMAIPVGLIPMRFNVKRYTPRLMVKKIHHDNSSGSQAKGSIKTANQGGLKNPVTSYGDFPAQSAWLAGLK